MSTAVTQTWFEQNCDAAQSLFDEHPVMQPLVLQLEGHT